MTSSISIPSPEDTGSGAQRWAAALARSQWPAWLPLLGLTILSLLVNGWGLSKAGYGNTYYAAAARSMSESWHNFFFGAFDPGGFITVDKPPVFLWVDALSVRIFGYSTLSLMLPSAVAGAAAVALLWLTVRRYFGVQAATIAGLVLALSPIAVAVNRLNTPEPFFILALIGAAACVLRSLDGGSRWWAWVAAAGILVGVAFNTKMLAAWIPGPALALAIVAGVPGGWRDSWRHFLPRLVLLGAATLIVSASWLAVVDAWPADSRPYIGGSKDNTVGDLVIGYNGLGRVEGEANGPSGGGRPTTANQPPIGPDSGEQRDGQQGGNPPGIANQPGAVARATGIISGEPGLWRMFDASSGPQIAWLLPFALIGGVVSLWRWRDNNLLRASVLLWLGWVLLYGAVFSSTQGIYHSYYTAAMAPGIAALTGMGVLAVRDLSKQHWGWLGVGLGMAAVTAWLQLMLTGRVEGFFEWATPVMVLTVTAGALLLAATALRRGLSASAGMSVVVAGLLLIPAAWSGYESAHASLNTTLPQAGPRGGIIGLSFGSATFDRGLGDLAAWLESQDTRAQKWQLVTSGAQNASTLIARYDLSVLALGGFSGNDPTITPRQFSELVARSEVRYVLTASAVGRLATLAVPPRDGANRAPADGGAAAAGQSRSVVGASAVMAAVQAACTPVTEESLPDRYRGSVYDCAGKAAELAAP